MGVRGGKTDSACMFAWVCVSVRPYKCVGEEAYYNYVPCKTRGMIEYKQA